MKPLPPEVVVAMLKLAQVPGASAATAMVKAGPRILPDVIAAIHNSDMWVRIGAVTVLGAMANQSTAVWPPLIDALSDSDGTVSGQAEIQFGRVPEADAQSVVAQLGPLLHSNQSRPRIAVLHAMQYMGPKAHDATPDLAMLLKDKDPEIRTQVASTLRLIGPGAKAAVDALHVALKDSDPHVRAQAAFALGSIDPRDPASMPVLIEALNSNGDDAWRAVDAISAMGTDARDAAPDLAQQLAVGRIGSLPDTYSDERLRTRIAENLGKIWGSQADAALSDALAQDKSEDVRRAALASIENLGADGAGAIPGLIQALRDENRGIREQAGRVLTKLGKVALAPLIAALHDPDLYIREGAIAALADYRPLPDEAARALTESAFKDHSHPVREAAVNALIGANIAAGNVAWKQLQQEEDAEQTARNVDENKRRYSKEDMIADIPADADHEYPMSLESMLTIDGTDFVVTVHDGQDLERLRIWKKTGDNQYRRTEVMEIDPDNNESFESPTIVNLLTGPSRDEMPFLYIVKDVYRGVDETLFAIDKDKDALEPVEIESAEKWYEPQLGDGEGVSIWSGNDFENDKAPAFDLNLTKPTDANCCPSGGRVVVTYRIVKETGASKDPVTWKLIPASATRQTIQKR